MTRAPMKSARLLMLLCTAFAFVQTVDAQTPADSLIRVRTAECIARYSRLILYTRDSLLQCNLGFLPLSEAGFTELAYEGGNSSRFVRYLCNTIRAPKAVRRQQIVGCLEVEFVVDTTGEMHLTRNAFRQYAPMPGEIPPAPVPDDVCREIEQSLLPCIGGAGTWTPIRDLTGQAYACRCRTQIEIGQEQFTDNLYIDVEVDERYLPPMQDATGNLLPRQLTLSTTCNAAKARRAKAEAQGKRSGTRSAHNGNTRTDK